MISCLSLSAYARCFVRTAPVLLGLFLLSGCEDNYSADLRYPLRDDAVVTDRFEKYTPKRFDPPGQLSFAVHQVLSSEGDEVDRKKILDPAKLDGGQRQGLAQALETFFGTPTDPAVKVDDGGAIALLKLDGDSLQKGSVLYRQHCLHCHGLTGNGRGPTAPWVNPHPRDYRSGIFKFSSSSQPDKERKPRRDDLRRTIREGIEGTSMPSFSLLPASEIEAMASYVTHLSVRGQTEFQLISELVRGDLAVDGISDRAKEVANAYTTWWQEAEGKLIKPPERPKLTMASVQAGYKLFQKEGGLGCISCHFDYGRQSNYLNDSWGTIVRAANLTEPVYRGGRRPIDLYWRIHSGINGANMPASGAAVKTPEDIWHVVNFLTVLPYPQMREEYKLEIH